MTKNSGRPKTKTLSLPPGQSRPFGKKPITPINELDIDKFPRETIHHLMLNVITNGLGQPTQIPILLARGRKPGPTFGITAAVHGNELNGIPVIHRLMNQVDLKNLSGSIAAAVVVNVPGYLAHKRMFSSGTDLNHIMPGQAVGRTEEIYVHRFMQRFVQKLDFLVDLHTASFGRVNCLYVRADMTNATAARMAYLQKPQIIVHNSPSDHTLRGAASSIGIPAITVEIGNPNQFQTHYIRQSLTGLRLVLAEFGMVKNKPLAEAPPPVICSGSYWIYTSQGGVLRVEPSIVDTVDKGESIAKVANIFGEVSEEYFAPEKGIVIGKSIDPVCDTGSRILHLGVIAKRGEGFVSKSKSARIKPKAL